MVPCRQAALPDGIFYFTRQMWASTGKSGLCLQPSFRSERKRLGLQER